ncbi:putative phage-related protein tail component [uncultured Mediterranean phage MEDS5 group]|uniref:Putative phage-related protein tail component n=1 Tax=uncultured Mediterranean phage MEDS5 group TaxID=1262075 RepID=K7XXM5_9CAUD|nr:putative phage-related protein tail component [uncultured Mediterranean phage MEDS5 group]BAR24333.1 putative phage-related protein tail component [uncultured Mediterranean phage uvMED]
MKVVKVYGALRERLGQCRFELDVATPAQAIKALCVNFPGLDKWLVDSEQDGVGYRVRVGKQQATPDDVSVLGLPWSEREVFSITPVVAGAGGGGFGQFLLGGLLIGASFLFPGAGLFGAGFGVFGPLSAGTIGTLTTVGTALSVVGASLVLGGVSQMLSPTPDLGDDSEKLRNFTFSGITNTIQQGLPVPIAYGRVVVGSAVISTGLDVDHSSNIYSFNGKLGSIPLGADFVAGEGLGGTGVFGVKT